MARLVHPAVGSDVLPPPPVYWMGPHADDVRTAGPCVQWDSFLNVACCAASDWRAHGGRVDDGVGGRPTWAYLTDMDRHKANTLLQWLETPVDHATGRTRGPTAWAAQLRRMLVTGIKAEIECVHNAVVADDVAGPTQAEGDPMALAAWVWARAAAPHLWL
jgi:hypothetical protein